jgi:hypothetical protein
MGNVAASCEHANKLLGSVKGEKLAQSLDIFLIYDNIRNNTISCILLHVSAELRHLQCVQKPIYTSV